MKVKTQSKKVNKAWLNDHANDTYVKLAKHEGYRARAAYKLKEIDETFKLIKPGHVVVDLGSTPGAWSQYVRRRLSPGGAAAGALNGTIVALDLLPMDPIEGVHFIQGDFTTDAVLQQLLLKIELLAHIPYALEPDLPAASTGLATIAATNAAANTAANTAANAATNFATPKRLIDVVVSDMAPNLSGISSTDAARISNLIELAVDFAIAHMKPEGALVVKLFNGEGYAELVKLFRATFKVVKPIKPKASRDKSSETFLVGMGLKSV